MRSILAAAATCLALIPVLAHAAAPLDGRWEGRVDVPGRDLPLILDLAPADAGVWKGSIVIPGLGIKGASLANLVVADVDVSFDLGNVLASPTRGATAFKARLQSADRMAGEMRQAGNVAPFVLTKSGPAQVDAPPRSTPIARELATRWTGEFELGGYPRNVTLALENRGADGAAARFVIVGKGTTDAPIDLVVQQGSLLRLESQAMQIVYEGRVKSDSSEIRGVIELGPFERPLVLRRARRP